MHYFYISKKQKKQGILFTCVALKEKPKTMRLILSHLILNKK